MCAQDGFGIWECCTKYGRHFYYSSTGDESLSHPASAIRKIPFSFLCFDFFPQHLIYTVSFRADVQRTARKFLQRGCKSVEEHFLAITPINYKLFLAFPTLLLVSLNRLNKIYNGLTKRMQNTISNTSSVGDVFLDPVKVTNFVKSQGDHRFNMTKIKTCSRPTHVERNLENSCSCDEWDAKFSEVITSSRIDTRLERLWTSGKLREDPAHQRTFHWKIVSSSFRSILGTMAQWIGLVPLTRPYINWIAFSRRHCFFTSLLLFSG